MDWVIFRCPESSRSSLPVRTSQSLTDLPPAARIDPSGERATGWAPCPLSKNSFFIPPVCVSQNLTGSSKGLPIPAVFVTSVPPSGLRATEVNSRSPAAGAGGGRARGLAGLQQPARSRFPDARPAVALAADEPRAVRGKGDRGNAAVVSLQGSQDGAGLRIADLDQSVGGGRDHRRAVRRVR